jgi:MraZ protein
VGYMLYGQNDVTLDEKGRISLPVSLRKVLGDAKLIIKSSDYDKEKSLWLFPETDYLAMLEDYKKEYKKMKRITSEKLREFNRRYHNFKDVEIDKAGRIAISQEYREYANLSKDCIVLGVGDYIEIWDKETYRRHYSESNEAFISASEEISDKAQESEEGDEE